MQNINADAAVENTFFETGAPQSVSFQTEKTSWKVISDPASTFIGACYSLPATRILHNSSREEELAITA